MWVAKKEERQQGKRMEKTVLEIERDRYNRDKRTEEVKKYISE